MNGRKILLVEPDRRFLSELAAQLVAEECQVCTATDVVEGYQAFCTHAPNLVVVSLDLPGGGGPHLHEQIRRDWDSSVPVVYITEENDATLRERAGELGAAAILERPGPISGYIQTIRTLLKGGTPSRGRSLRILVVEDDPDQRALIEACLAAPSRETVDVTFAQTVGEACARITEERFGCILLDHRLPDGNGVDVLEEVEEHLLTTPVIGLSADDDAAVAVDYFRGGCIDFFAKDEVLNADTLRRGIAQALSKFQRRAMATLVERQQLGNAIVKSQEGLITLARTDRLMGICNRAVFDDYLPRFHDEAVEQSVPYAICMVDVDHFKSYNDRYGHAAGDDALKVVAKALSETLREDDFIARYGGEEIVVLLADVDDVTGPAVADRLRGMVEKAAVTHEGGGTNGIVTVSIGLAVLAPGSGESVPCMLLRADDALYVAKSRGRNRVVTAPASPDATRASA